MESPSIVTVKRGSLEDGPGIRSVIFFKGCPLRCVFCQNPETQDPRPEIAHHDERCTRCGACAAACPRTDESDACRACSACVNACPQGALTLLGRQYTVDDLLELLLRDEPYYRSSGGGVTFSGGECTMFPAYLEAVAVALKAKGIHLAIETCGDFAFEFFAQHLLPLLDLIYFDVKLADPELHRAHTGRDNRRILENLARLAQVAPERLRARIPLVPGITLTDENLAGIIRHLRACGLRGATLLPYNPLGQAMAERLGRDHPMAMKQQRADTPAAATPALPASFMTPAESAAATARFERIVREVYGALGQEKNREEQSHGGS